MNFPKRTSKVLKLCFMVSVCGSVLIGIVLLSKVHYMHSNTYGGQNRRFTRYHEDVHIQINPRHILPALVRRIRAENTTPKVAFNQSVSKLNMTFSRDKGVNAVPVRSEDLPLKSSTSEELFQLGETTEQPNYNLHAFYYPWYGTPEHDGQYLHWNHPYIPHWNKKEAQKWPNYTHKPPDDIGSNFYPLLGAYSSRDTKVIDVHMRMMRYARIGVIVVSWYPPGDADNQGREPDSLLPLILEGASKYNLKVALHIEPYKGRNSVTLKENLKYIDQKYGSHPAFYRTSLNNKKDVPLIYIYDSYLVDSQDWAAIFAADGKESVRNTELDGIFIGLLVESGHKQHIVDSHFDGFYTYFATNQFTYGSTWKKWPELAEFAHTKGLTFIPSVGPGYVDTEVRPWNGANTRKRLGGKYFNEAFTNALNVNPAFVSITSFNEWHEGTQIEPAIDMKIQSRRYEDYGSKGPNFYLDLTKAWVEKMIHRH